MFGSSLEYWIISRFDSALDAMVPCLYSPKEPKYIMLQWMGGKGFAIVNTWTIGNTRVRGVVSSDTFVLCRKVARTYRDAQAILGKFEWSLRLMVAGERDREGFGEIPALPMLLTRSRCLTEHLVQLRVPALQVAFPMFISLVQICAAC